MRRLKVKESELLALVTDCILDTTTIRESEKAYYNAAWALQELGLIEFTVVAGCSAYSTKLKIKNIHKS